MAQHPRRGSRILERRNRYPRSPSTPPMAALPFLLMRTKAYPWVSWIIARPAAGNAVRKPGPQAPSPSNMVWTAADYGRAMGTPRLYIPSADAGTQPLQHPKVRALWQVLDSRVRRNDGRLPFPSHASRDDDSEPSFNNRPDSKILPKLGRTQLMPRFPITWHADLFRWGAPRGGGGGTAQTDVRHRRNDRHKEKMRCSKRPFAQLGGRGLVLDVRGTGATAHRCRRSSHATSSHDSGPDTN